MPWQSPGTSPKPSLKALQEAPHHLTVNPRARETENHPVILPMHGRAEVPTCVRLQSMPPTSGPEPLTLCSSACAFGSGTWTLPVPYQRVHVDCLPTRWAEAVEGLARPPSGLWAAEKTEGSGASYCDPRESEGRVLGSAGTEQNCPLPQGTTVLVSKDQGRSLSWAGSDTKDTPHTQQTRPSHTCRPLSSRDTGISSGTLSSSHRGGNKVTMYPRIPGWHVEMGKMAQGGQTAGKKLLHGFGTQTSPPRTFWTAFLRKCVYRHEGYLASPPSDRKLHIPISPERQTDTQMLTEQTPNSAERAKLWQHLPRLQPGHLLLADSWRQKSGPQGHQPQGGGGRGRGYLSRKDGLQGIRASSRNGLVLRSQTVGGWEAAGQGLLLHEHDS